MRICQTFCVTQYQMVPTSHSVVDIVEFLEQLIDESSSRSDEIDSLVVLNQFCDFGALNDTKEELQNYV